MINYSVFHPTINSTLGFRECALLVQIAKQTNTTIEIHANNKIGTTDSIISLMQLGIKENSGVVFIIRGNNQVECCHQVMDVIENGWQPTSQKKTTLMSCDDVVNVNINNDNNNKIIFWPVVGEIDVNDTAFKAV